MTTTIVLDNLNSKDPKVKYGYAKELLKIGATKPEMLYDHFDEFLKLLSSSNNILKWTGIDLIGYLSSIDKDNKSDSTIEILLEFLHCGHLITCNHAIFALGKIAEKKPEQRKEIIDEFLKIQNDMFDTLECKNIAIGKVIDAIKPFSTEIRNNEKVINFIEAATTNDRISTKKKATQLLKRIRI
ncbi:MAG: hypothetical protein ACOYOA_13510 [Saprospiraceae bacterium]